MTTSQSTPSGLGLSLADNVMSAVLARHWWAITIRGVLAIVFGLIALFSPGVTMLSLVLVFAAYIFLDGVFAIVAAFRSREHGVLMVLEGVVDIIAAAVAVFWPAITVLAFVLLVAAWAIVTGALMLAAAFRLEPDQGRWWLVLGGAVSVIYGGLLALSPIIGALVLTWWIGAYAIVFGVAMLVLSLRLRKLKDS